MSTDDISYFVCSNVVSSFPFALMHNALSLLLAPHIALKASLPVSMLSLPTVSDNNQVTGVVLALWSAQLA